MIRGIGIDMVDITRIQKMTDRNSRVGDAFLRRTFTDAERAQGEQVHNPAEYYATRFAAKEAVFKAVAHLLPEQHFDLRIVETLNHEDGCPYVNVTDRLRPVLEAAGVNVLHISITTETDYAAAYVIAEQSTAAGPDGPFSL